VRRGILWLPLALSSCGEEEAQPAACPSSWSFTQPAVPSCAEISGRIAEVSVERWRDELEQAPAGAVFVSQPHCGDGGDGSIDAPLCWLDQGIALASGLDHGIVYLDPGDYSIMGDVACQGGGDPPTIDIIGAGAHSTRVHLTCDLVGGVWSFVDLGLAAEKVTVAAGNKLSLERVMDQDLNGEGFLDVQGELVLTDAVIDLGHPLDDVTGGEGQAAVTMSTITGTTAAPLAAVALSAGAQAAGTGVCISQALGVGILATGNGTSLTLHGAVVEQTRSTNETGSFGYGIAVEDGASLVASQLMLDANRGVGALVSGSASATIDASIIQGGQSNDAEGSGLGLIAQDGAQVSVAASAFTGNYSPGAVVASGASLAVTDSEITGNGFAGLAVLAASLELSGSRVAENQSSPSDGGGLGLYVYDLVPSQPVGLAVNDSIFEAQPGQLYVLGDPSRTTGTLANNRFAATSLPPYGFTARIFETGEGLALQGNCFEGEPQLLLHAGLVDLQGNSYAPVTDSFTIKQQLCDDVALVDVGLESLPEPDGLQLCDGPSVETDPRLEYLLTLVEPVMQGR
jgi:hypothetical protein